jgi:hypothetical protein
MPIVRMQPELPAEVSAMRVDSCAPCHPPRQAEATSAKTAAAVGGQVHSRSLDVTITTADGDRVTLSASESASIAGVATSDGRRAGVSSTESSVSLTVEGSLDRREWRDLRKVLKVLAKAAAHQDSERLARRLSRPDLDTIATVQASYSESVAVIGGVLAIAPQASVVPEAPAPADRA